MKQIDVVRPEVIVALGATAATYLLGVRQSLSSLRGRWHAVRGAKVAVTYHPAYLLRDPRQKAETWKDLLMVMKEMGLEPPKTACVACMTHNQFEAVRRSPAKLESVTQNVGL